MTKFSREEENSLVQAIKQVDSLKTASKLQMASVKVVNLQQKQDEL
jgi:hypothetical protein